MLYIHIWAVYSGFKVAKIKKDSERTKLAGNVLVNSTC